MSDDKPNLGCSVSGGQYFGMSEMEMRRQLTAALAAKAEAERENRDLKAANERLRGIKTAAESVVETAKHGWLALSAGVSDWTTYGETVTGQISRLKQSLEIEAAAQAAQQGEPGGATAAAVDGPRLCRSDSTGAAVRIVTQAQQGKDGRTHDALPGGEGE